MASKGQARALGVQVGWRLLKFGSAAVASPKQLRHQRALVLEAAAALGKRTDEPSWCAAFFATCSSVATPNPQGQHTGGRGGSAVDAREKLAATSRYSSARLKEFNTARRHHGERNRAQNRYGTRFAVAGMGPPVWE